MSHPPSAHQQHITRWAIGLFVLLHTALLTFNLLDSDAVFRGDRASVRFDKAVDITASGFGALAEKLLQYGMPGDYLLHTVFYALGGVTLVLVLQMLAGLMALIWSMRLAQMLGASPLAAACAGLLLTLLPGSLMHPHQFVTETLYSAAITGGVYYLARWLQLRQPRWLWIGFFGLTLATWLRPQGCVLVALAAMLLWLWRAAPRPQLVAISLVAAVLSIGSWVGWRYSQTQQLGLGPADFDLPTNFKMRADRIANIESIPGWVNYDIVGQRYLRLTPDEFAGLLRQHPSAAAKTYATDVVNLLANPGANAFLGRFLGWFEQGDDQLYWMKTLDTAGVWGVVKALFKQPLFLLGMASFALLHGLFYGLAAWGLYDRQARNGLPQARTLLIAITLAQLLISFLSGTVRWTYRTPVEPLIAVIVALAIAAVMQRWQQRRHHAAPVLAAE